MTQSHFFDPPTQPFERPKCPQCEAHMWLVQIEPDKPEHDTRMFECPRCQHAESVVVKYR